MKVITYLAFTVLSIFIQFCVMDYIQEKIQLEDTTKIDLHVTSKKEILSDLLKNISSKPHALYYRALDMSRSLKGSSPSKVFNNSSMVEVTGTTDGTTTVFDVLYDENTSATEETPTTTEMNFISISTEIDNVTEITFFETKNKSANVPSTTPKKSLQMHCNCDLLYKVCDINCCCDQDCSLYEHKIFQCQETSKAEDKETDGCISHIIDVNRYGGSMLDNLFCVVKTNLPSKRSIKMYQAPTGTYYEWRNVEQKQQSYEFKKTLYELADPIWLLKNGRIYYLDFPGPMINNYCTDRIPIAFLKEEKITCNVRLKDLEMFHILETSEQAMVISATNNTLNSTALNCTNLHCTNWTILACENGLCSNYNKTYNEPSCTEHVCTNIALKIDYGFYYYDMKIINATIKLHLQNISFVLPFMVQEVGVHFYLANKSIEHVIELSGNPGYVSGLPIILSHVKSNHTEHFFNNTSEIGRRMIFPENRNGLCESSNTSNNIVTFGINKRTKCRYINSHTSLSKKNMCNNIHNDINELLRLKSNVSISPFGNPHGIADDNWINLLLDINKQEPVYGEYNENTLKLYCYNLINRLSVTFMFANVNEKSFIGQNKILSAKFDISTKNLSFNIEDISFVITIDVNFVDLTKPSIIEYAGSPHINIHLPKDFFFPFPQNGCFYMSNMCTVTIYCIVILFLCK